MPVFLSFFKCFGQSFAGNMIPILLENLLDLLWGLVGEPDPVADL